jgi:ribonuclease J
MAHPEIELIGIPDADASGRRMEEVVSEAIEEAFAALPKPRRRDPSEISEAVRRAVRSAVAERWRKKPICHVHVLVV